MQVCELINPDITLIIGPTASGKTKAALALADETGAEIISADAFQVYRGMDIGTAKPTIEELSIHPHHLIDILNPDVAYSVSQFVNLANQAVEEIRAKGKPVIICGGTGFYIHSFLYQYSYEDLPSASLELRAALEVEAKTNGADALYSELIQADPAAKDRINPNNIRRIIRALEIVRLGKVRPSEALKKAETRRQDVRIHLIDCPRPELIERINLRVDHMIAQGLVDEVKRLVETYGADCQALQAIGYRELLPYLRGEEKLENAIEQIKIHTRQFARRQMTWYRKINAQE